MRNPLPNAFFSDIAFIMASHFASEYDCSTSLSMSGSFNNPIKITYFEVARVVRSYYAFPSFKNKQSYFLAANDTYFSTFRLLEGFISTATSTACVASRPGLPRRDQRRMVPDAEA